MGQEATIPVKVDWPELQLTEEQLLQNSVARANDQDPPFPDLSIFNVRIKPPVEPPHARGTMGGNVGWAANYPNEPKWVEQNPEGILDADLPEETDPAELAKEVAFLRRRLNRLTILEKKYADDRVDWETRLKIEQAERATQIRVAEYLKNVIVDAIRKA